MRTGVLAFLAAAVAGCQGSINNDDILIAATMRVSLGWSGSQTVKDAISSSISGDGRYVAFVSMAGNLVPNDTNNDFDVFVRDTHAGTTMCVSADSSGLPVGGTSPSISGDGRLVAFSSGATTLVVPDDNGTTSDVYVRILETGAIARVSVASSGTQADGGSYDPAISGDGSCVAFISQATNLSSPPGGGVFPQIYARNLTSGETFMISVDSTGTSQGGGPCTQAVISMDGNYVAFTSLAPDLSSVADANSMDDIYIRDWLAASPVTEAISLDAGGFHVMSDSLNPSISGDGGIVVFQTRGALEAGDLNGREDIYLWERTAPAVRRISFGSQQVEPVFGCFDPSISRDGTIVAFETFAGNLVSDDSNDFVDIFVRHLPTGSIERASVRTFGAQGLDESKQPRMSQDGRFVAFYSRAGNLVDDDTNSVTDVFVRGPLR